MKALVRTVVFKRDVELFNDLALTVYRADELSWREIVIRSKESNLINRLIEEASIAAYNSRIADGYSMGVAEAPGLTAWEVEGEGGGIVINPGLVKLRKLTLFKAHGERLTPIKEYEVRGDLYVYDGEIRVEGVEYDAIGIYSENYVRIVLKEELYQTTKPRTWVKVKQVRKRRKR
ncbi:MAG: hypothetical protein N3E36_01810 [Sulfolobales archaeon]|nr:hypothetical protein [Sulfolobales archaeon]MCX8198750.1 hypothetical protein [Sulfolobales archaeon]MDW8169823.1 hypothetical protein [Desulfurococcaceae archaeon]